MDPESLWAEIHGPSTEDPGESEADSFVEDLMPRPAAQVESLEPGPIEQSRLFDLLGRINYKILQGGCVYLRVCGVVYKVLYGVYWQSIFSGVQHWGLRCAEIDEGMWIDGCAAAVRVDLPLRYTKDGWVVEVQSFEFLLYGDLPAIDRDITAHPTPWD